MKHDSVAGVEPEILRWARKSVGLTDPFVIACARINQATVVTEEGWQRGGKSLALKPNAATIPNVCAHFKIPCIDLEEFMH